VRALRDGRSGVSCGALPGSPLSGPPHPLFLQDSKNRVRVALLLLQLTPLLRRPCGLPDAVHRVAEIAEHPRSAVAGDYQLLQLLQFVRRRLQPLRDRPRRSLPFAG